METRALVGAFTGFISLTCRTSKAWIARRGFFTQHAASFLVISAQAAVIVTACWQSMQAFFDLTNFICVLVGFVVAHMISNLSNDYFGFRHGHDTPDSPRMRYTVHPLSGGVLDRRTLITGTWVACVCRARHRGIFFAEHGLMAAAFFIAGVSLLFLYDAGPAPLKTIGFGELAVLLVWGPIMIGGGFAMITGQLSTNVMLASLPYGLGVMTILVGKHIDQIDFDSAEISIRCRS